eukprot:TRINITY_DN18808_c0_g1_i3.p1 TRINITY_DN18808_c0_g1~~TRINITY_DN18808_c0_g1_i3.p1  ORF type:complete len:367 (-),score=78.23 TRINITY_DN18808_c0_g1_i3:108-1208(-)
MPKDDGQEHVMDTLAVFALNSGWPQDNIDVTSHGPRLRDERREHLRDVFHGFDTDGSGGISCEELTKVLRKLGMDMADTQELMEEADTNKNGVLDLNEFVDWLYGQTGDANLVLEYGEALRPLFEVFDKDQSGVISPSEFRECHFLLQAALQLNPTDEGEVKADPLKLKMNAEEVFASVDKNSDKAMNFVDFARYMKSIVLDSGISEKDLQESVAALAHALKECFIGMSMAESGEIEEDNPMELASRVNAVADSVKRLSSEISNAKAVDSSEGRVWKAPPQHLTMAGAKSLHMTCFPVNMRLVKRFQWHVICIPINGVWNAEISRELCFRSEQVRKEQARYYYFDVGASTWAQTSEVASWSCGQDG